MIHHLWLRWLVTGLSVLSAAEWVHVIIRVITTVVDGRRRAWTLVVSYALHLAMAIAMAVMAWPWGTPWPTFWSSTGPAVFFLLATVWFVTVTIVWARTPVQRLLRCYHALMALAMAWMYATMGLRAHASQAPSMSMPGMDMGPDPTGAPPGWITAGNWFWFVSFVVAALVWAYLVFARSRSRSRWLYGAGQAMMAAAMAITFGALIFEV